MKLCHHIHDLYGCIITSKMAASSRDQPAVMEKYLNEEENELITALKRQCDSKGRELNPKDSATIFHKLGLIYKERDSDKLCLIQSAALLMAARLRNPDQSEQLQKDLENLWNLVLRKAMKKENRNVELKSISEKARSKVLEMRSQVKKDLANIPILDNIELSYVEITRQEKHKINCIENLQKQITSDYKALMKDIANTCVDILGEAPLSCKFALVGMGSLARKEVTPYSDFECIIVLEEGIQLKPNYEDTLEYFRWFAVVFQIIVITLGETILPSVAIPCLNNFYLEDGNWFYDDFTPSGISFDGFMPYACKTPLGRQPSENKPWKTELIKPVNEMLKYLSSEQDLKNGYHLADILTQTCFVSGDESLYDEFWSGVNLEMKKQRENETEFYAKLNCQFHEDAAKFDVIVDLLSFVFLPTDLSVKRVFYRGLTIFLSALAKYHGFESSSSFETINDLYEVEFMTEVDQHYFRYGLAIACELRLKVCEKKERQGEKLKLYPTTDALSVQDLSDMVGKKCLVDFFSVANTLQNTQFEFNRKNLSFKYESRSSSSCNLEILLGSTLYGVEKEILSVCKNYMHMFKLIGTTKLHASAWFFIGLCLLKLKNTELDAKVSFVKCIRELLPEENGKGANFYKSCLGIYDICIQFVTALLTSVRDVMKNISSDASIEQAIAKYTTLAKLHKLFKSCSDTKRSINSKGLIDSVIQLFHRLGKFLSMLKMLELEAKEDIIGNSDYLELD